MSGAGERGPGGRLRVAAVGYLNARPLIEGLDREPLSARVVLECAAPSEVARSVAEDEADVALMPVAAAASIGELRLVRGCAIGARGAVRSVVIAADRPIDALDELAVDLSSRTSVVLARLLLRARGGRQPRLIGCFAARRDRVDRPGARGALVIGDPALDIEGRHPHVLDLGQAWLELTGLPFVFAAWCGRAGAVTADEERLLVEARAAGLARRDAIADAHAERSGLAAPSLRAYLRDAIRYDLGDDERRGLERFYDEAAAAGLLPPARVRFMDDDRTRPSPAPALDSLLARAAEGARLSRCRGASGLLSDASLFDLGVAADARCAARKHPSNVVTYIVDRKRLQLHERLHDELPLLRVLPTPGPPGGVRPLSRGARQETKGGGRRRRRPDPPAGRAAPGSPDRVVRGALPLDEERVPPGPPRAVARRDPPHRSPRGARRARRARAALHAAGLDSVPGGGAEILVDRVRRQIAKAKCTSEEWLGVMRVAHQMGLRSSATMMYGTVDTPRDRVGHLLKIRDLQDETGGFTAFFCWDFQHERGTHIEAGDHGTLLYLRQQALARILLDNVDHVGASWVTQGPEVGQVALRFGADGLRERHVRGERGLQRRHHVLHERGRHGAPHPRRGLQGGPAERAVRLAHAAVVRGHARDPR